MLKILSIIYIMFLYNLYLCDLSISYNNDKANVENNYIFIDTYKKPFIYLGDYFKQDNIVVVIYVIKTYNYTYLKPNPEHYYEHG